MPVGWIRVRLWTRPCQPTSVLDLTPVSCTNCFVSKILKMANVDTFFMRLKDFYCVKDKLSVTLTPTVTFSNAAKWHKKRLRWHMKHAWSGLLFIHTPFISCNHVGEANWAFITFFLIQTLITMFLFYFRSIFTWKKKSKNFVIWFHTCRIIK